VVGGGEDGRKYILTSFILLYLGEASEIWEVPRNPPESRQEVLLDYVVVKKEGRYL
jgi:hypothetical protein